MIKKNRIGDYGDFPPNWEKTKVLESGTKIVVVTNGCAIYELILDKRTAVYHEEESGEENLSDPDWVILSDSESTFMIQDSPHQVTDLNGNDEDLDGDELDDIPKVYLDGTWIVVICR